MAVDDDFIRREYEHQRYMADEEHRRKMEVRRYRNEIVTKILLTVVVLTILIGGGFLLWRGVTQANPAEVACTERGGTWASINDGGYTCLWIGKVAEP